MACFCPITAHVDGLTKNGKKLLVFNKKEESSSPDCLRIPCGRCVGCRMERARQWSLRCKHEAQMCGQGCFVTLTYNEQRVPRQLEPLDLRLFLDRLRKEIIPNRFRYVACGEYGPRFSRPHFHVLIFGFDFPDKQLWKTKPFRWYRSEMLERLWTAGFSLTADLTEASACYVARYTLKKVYGKEKAGHYGDRRPEFLRMSLKPGIGKSWFEKFKGDLYPEGIYVKEGGGRVMPPDYYDRLYERVDPLDYARLKLDRCKYISKDQAEDVIHGKLVKVPNNDGIRLPVRESIFLSKLRTLKRGLEDGSYENEGF